MKNKKIAQIIFIICLCCLPLIMLCSCGLSDTIMCTWCGDKTNRVVLYASGTEDGIKYKSCVGISGCLGIGCDSVCFPVECLYVESYNGDADGCIYYYEDGCIDGENVKSYGKYVGTTGCLGITCSKKIYKEYDYGEDIEAFNESENCFGCSTNEESGIPLGFNDILPRQFSRGCWSCTGSDD